MSFPKRVEMQLPLLQTLLALGGEARPSDVYEPMAAMFPAMTAVERNEPRENGEPQWENAVRFTRQDLVKLDEIDGSIHGVWRVTEKGRARVEAGAGGGEPEIGHPVYTAAARFSAAGLREGSSMFVPDARIWNTDTFDDLHRRFVLQPDESDRDFITKLREQLQGAPDDTIQLAAELLYVHLLVPCVLKGAAKRKLLGAVLSWGSKSVPLPPDLDRALDRCLITDMTFNLQRPFFLAFLVEFGLAWWRAEPQAREEAMADPWQFKEFVTALPAVKAIGQREALLHLVHPDTFESISSRKHKERIAKVFSDRIPNDAPSDVDRRLFMLRPMLQREFGAGFNYYSPKIRPLWAKNTDDRRRRWESFIDWIGKIVRTPSVGREQREPSLRIAAVIEAAKDALDREDWVESLRSAFRAPQNDLTSESTHERFLQWCAANAEQARNTLKGLWSPEGGASDRLGEFAAHVPRKILPRVSEQAQIGSFLLMAGGAEQCPVVRSAPLKQAFLLAGHPHFPKGGDVREYYDHAIGFFDRVVDAAREAGVDMRDRLDAQSAIWALTKWEQPPAEWSESDKAAFLDFRGDEADEDDDPPPPDEPEEAEIDGLASEVFIAAEDLTEMLELLREKGQVIFYGPPGTGKTFVAQRLAEYMAGSVDRVRVVQFHAAYSYEDFVEGFRPSAEGGFTLQPGPLRQFASEALANPAKPFVMLIDEINRANIAKVFGELYFLLEYRNASVAPMYRPTEKLRIPPNLFFIGTMNTADRSIALLDAAIRRRFYFFPFFPDRKPVEGLLRRWLDRPEGQPAFVWVADMLDEVNRRVREQAGGRHLAIGPSHFMKPRLTESKVERIWRHAIIPHLEELFFGEEERLLEFSFEKVRTSVRAAGEREISGDDQTQRA